MTINYEKFRPCVRQMFDVGMREKLPKQLYNDMRSKMVYYIISEFSRIGVDAIDIKQKLLEWNDRCIFPLTAGDSKRKLCDYTDWFFKKERKLSCKALMDCCLFPSGSGCFFQRQAEYTPLKYSLGEMQTHLERTYPAYGRGYRMFCVIEALIKCREEKRVEVLYIGLRRLSAVIYQLRQARIEEKRLSELLNQLEEAGVIQITRGKRGTVAGRANEYRFLPVTSHTLSDVQACANS